MANVNKVARIIWPIALVISLPVLGFAIFGGGGIFIGAAFAFIGVIQWMKKNNQRLNQNQNQSQSQNQNQNYNKKKKKKK